MSEEKKGEEIVDEELLDNAETVHAKAHIRVVPKDVETFEHDKAIASLNEEEADRLIEENTLEEIDDIDADDDND